MRTIRSIAGPSNAFVAPSSLTIDFSDSSRTPSNSSGGRNHGHRPSTKHRTAVIGGMGIDAGIGQRRRGVPIAEVVRDAVDRAVPVDLERSARFDRLLAHRDGVLGPVARSGGSTTIVLFQLADGSRRAIGVRYELRDELPSAYDRGPERRPGRGGDGAPAPTP